MRKGVWGWSRTLDIFCTRALSGKQVLYFSSCYKLQNIIFMFCSSNRSVSPLWTQQSLCLHVFIDKICMFMSSDYKDKLNGIIMNQ